MGYGSSDAEVGTAQAQKSQSDTEESNSSNPRYFDDFRISKPVASAPLRRLLLKRTSRALATK